MNQPMRRQPKPKRGRVAKKPPAYEADDGPLTAKQPAAIKKHEPPRGRKVRSSLLSMASAIGEGIVAEYILT